MFRVTRRYEFAASHRLDSPALSEEQNRQLYGKCNNPHGHGHNYVIEVSVRGPLDEISGRAVDTARLDELVAREVLGHFHQRNLNAEIAAFSVRVPTSENLAAEVCGRLKAAWHGNSPVNGRNWNESASPRRRGTSLRSEPMKSNKAKVEVMQPQREDARIAPLVKDILLKLGEDPGREGLLRTPERVEQALQFLTSGYRVDVRKILNGALYNVKYDEMVVVKDIEFFSMCEHHMLPFYGKMHVAYLPKQKVIGLSKIPRIVDAFARRLQIQERLTQQVAETLQEVLDPVGVGVICEARHFCMMMRGVEKQHSGAMTSAMLGDFRDRKSTRDEFLSLVNHKASSF